MQYQYRIADASDAPALSKLLRSAMLTYCANSGISAALLEAMTESIEAIEDRVTHNTCMCFFSGDEAVATITVSTIDTPQKLSFSRKTHSYLSRMNKVGYISRFAVKEGLRQSGLGVQLMEMALDLARERGCAAVLLHSCASNRPMVDFYSNRGFRLIDVEDSRGYDRGLFSYSFSDDKHPL
ncbi:MAG: GNAT family N-acetyltransferase [Saccharofermentans sp.]|nr:GNAT family N-acetyltransferase [Saccharofermentans sp.]